MDPAMSFPAKRIEEAWASLRRNHPLVYHLTNEVAMTEQAHVALAVGASPVMSRCAEEALDFAALADATLVNIGTPSAGSLALFEKAAQSAGRAGRPVVLDPVGYGATAFRTRLAEALLEQGNIAVVKGNASEICLLAGQDGFVRGVDRGIAPDPAQAVLELAESRNVIAAATGEVDWVSDGIRVWSVLGGHPLLESFSGSGCWLGTLVAACVGASGDTLAGTCAALCAYGRAAEQAARLSKGPGSFRAHFIDALHGMTLSRPCFGEDRIREVSP
jgi:hydroxyethylthiazole kinase